MEQRYRIVEIKPKNGEKRDIHHRMESSICCEILELQMGCPAWIKYKPTEGDDRLAHTSIVEDVICLDDGSLYIHTKNTVYYLEGV